MQSAFAAWIFSIMVFLSPPDRVAKMSTHPEAKESVEDKTARYREIANDIAAVALDPEEPPLFGGKTGRAHTAALLTALAWMESGFRRDVHLGLGPRAKGGGWDTCLFQLHIGPGKTQEGWSARDILGDTQKCIRAGLHLVRRSYGACRGEEPEHKLSAYATGSCKSERGHALSAARIAVTRRVLARFAPPDLSRPAEEAQQFEDKHTGFVVKDHPRESAVPWNKMR